MGNFQKGGSRGGFRGGNRDDDRGSRGDFKKKSWGNDRGGDRGGDRDRNPVTMHRATCAECRKNCEVPFRPNGDRPVLCAECFGGKRDNDRGGRSDFGARPVRREFNNDRPSASFSKPTQSTDDLKKQISDLNTKVDRLLALVEKSLKAKGDTSLKGDPVIVFSKEKTKTPSLKTVIEEAVVEKAPAKAKKVVTKKKK